MDHLHAGWEPAPGDRVQVRGTGRTGSVVRVAPGGDDRPCEVEYDFLPNAVNPEVERWTHAASELRPIERTALRAIREQRARRGTDSGQPRPGIEHGG